MLNVTADGYYNYMCTEKKLQQTAHCDEAGNGLFLERKQVTGASGCKSFNGTTLVWAAISNSSPSCISDYHLSLLECHCRRSVKG